MTKYDWIEPPSLEETGATDPRKHGAAFSAIPAEYYQHWPVRAVLPSWADYNTPQFESRIAGTDDPHVYTDGPHFPVAELQNLPVAEQPGSVGGATQVPVAEQPAPLAQRSVSWELDTQPSETRTHPPCQAPISVPQTKAGLEKYLMRLHSGYNNLKKKKKKRVFVLEQQQEEIVEKC